MKALINIWMSPIYARLNMDSRRSLYVMSALFPVCGLVIAFIDYLSKGVNAKLSVFPIAFLLSSLLFLVIFFIGWFVMLVTNICVHFSPANAALTPRLKQRLKLALALPVIVAATVVVVAVSIAEQQVRMYPALVLVLFCAYFVGTLRASWLVFPALLTLQIPIMANRTQFFKNATFEAFQRSIGFELLILFVSVGILWGVLHWFFTARDEALFAMHKRTKMMRQGFSARDVPSNRFANYFNSPFVSWMQHCVRRAQGLVTPSEKLNLSGFSLGARMHWTSISTQFLLIASFVFVFKFVARFFLKEEGEDFFSGFTFGFAASMLIAMPIAFLALNSHALYHTRTEQALFSLTPAAADGHALDKSLTHYLLWQFFVTMLFCLLGALVLLNAMPNAPWGVEFLSLGLSCLSIFSLSVAYPYGRMRAANDHPMLKLGLLVTILMLLGVVLTIFVSSQIAWWMSAAILVVTCVVLWRRLQRNALSLQFPVGRAVN